MGGVSRQDFGCDSQSLKALCNDGGVCNWLEVIPDRSCGVLRHWHNGGGLKACEDNYLVENVREDPGQLLCTDSMAANACAPGFTRSSEAEYKSLKASGNVKGGNNWLC